MYPGCNDLTVSGIHFFCCRLYSAGFAIKKAYRLIAFPAFIIIFPLQNTHMRNYLLIAIIVLLTNCNSKTKTDNKDAGDKTGADTAVVKQNTGDTAATNPPPTAGKIDIETFGDIKLGMTEKEFTQALGQPDSKSKPVEWGADGMLHEDWTYKAKGLVINISSEKKTPAESKTLFSISAKAPCTFKTRAGMGIGSSYAEVKEAYKRDIDPQSEPSQIVVGSVYGGIIFTFKNEKAETIFLGAAAE